MATKRNTKNVLKVPLSKSEAGAQYTLKEVKDVCFLYRSIEDFIQDDEWEEGEYEHGQIDLDALKLSFKHGIEFDDENALVTIYFKIRFVYLDKYEVIRYGVKADFHILNLTEVFSRSEKGRLRVAEKFLVSFFGITISTARGILISHLSGTAYSHIHIPIFSPGEIYEVFVEQYMKMIDGQEDASERKAAKPKRQKK